MNEKICVEFVKVFLLWQIVTFLGITIGSTRKSKDFVGDLRSQNVAAWERGLES